MSDSSDVDVSKDVVTVIDNDEDMEIFSKLLSTESGRGMMRLLVDEELYSSEIGRKLNLKSNMTSYYLSKMEAIKIVKVSNKKITKKGIEHRFFHIPSSIIVIALKKPKKNTKGVLKKKFRDGIKFTVIGVASIFSGGYFALLPEQVYDPHYPVPVMPEVSYFPLTVSLTIIVLGLITEKVLRIIKKRREW